MTKILGRAHGQTEFMIYEMQYGYGGFDLEAYKQMTDVLAATVYFHDVFEGSADSADAVRARSRAATPWSGTTGCPDRFDLGWERLFSRPVPHADDHRVESGPIRDLRPTAPRSSAVGQPQSYGRLTAMIRSLTALVASAALAAGSVAAVVPAQAANDGQYGRHDAGGFRNVLPPGSGRGQPAGVQRLHHLRALPDHWADQQPLYENLLYAAPTLKGRQIANYFKDATFGVASGDRASTERPRDGVKIIRDADWGPHIYGKTRMDTMFGAGYAGAADRLF